ncbi:MAG: virulence RhuM family protein [Bacteroidales bacterium]|nr:virulence RhuM family protein [Bacteroidales bacterium]
MNTTLPIVQPSSNSIVVYQSSDGVVQLDVQLADETVWLTLNQLSILFDRNKSVISRHISNIYNEGELSREATVAKNATVQNENGRRVVRQIEYYNLDVIISVGYRVKSLRGTQFRQWANHVLKEYLLKGYFVNNRLERLEQRVSSTEEKIDFFVRTSLPPVEGVIYAVHYTEEQKCYSCNYCHNQGLCQSAGVEARVGGVAQGDRQGGTGEKDEPLRRSADRNSDARPRDLRDGIIIGDKLYHW